MDLSKVTTQALRAELARRGEAGGRRPKLIPCPNCGKLRTARERLYACQCKEKGRAK